jgi:hypothetical protein
MMEAVSGDFKVGCPGVHVGLISLGGLAYRKNSLLKDTTAARHTQYFPKTVCHETLKASMRSILAEATLADAGNARDAKVVRDRFPAVMTESRTWMITNAHEACA